MSDHRPWQRLESLGLDGDGTRRVLGGNAVRLFGLT
jgi:hypothetical protein